MLYKRDSKAAIKVKTLCKKDITVPCLEALDVKRVKEEICSRSSSLTEKELNIISSGKRLSDDHLIQANGSGPVFVIVSTDATSTVEVTVREDSITHMIQFPVNMRISEMKRRLYNQKVTKIKPGEARIILNSRVVRDSSIIGDYLLGCCSPGLKSSKKSEVRLYISKTLDLKSEVNVALELPNRKVLRFSLEVGDSLCYLHDILEKQFGFPGNIPTQLYLESGTPLSPSLSLFDYGVKPGNKEVKMKIALVDSFAPAATSLHTLPMIVPVVVQMPQERNQGPMSMSALVIDAQVPQFKSCPPQLKKKPVSTKEGRGNAGLSGMFRGMKKGFLSSGKKESRK